MEEGCVFVVDMGLQIVCYCVVFVVYFGYVGVEFIGVLVEFFGGQCGVQCCQLLFFGGELIGQMFVFCGDLMFLCFKIVLYVLVLC